MTLTLTMSMTIPMTLTLGSTLQYIEANVSCVATP